MSAVAFDLSVYIPIVNSLSERQIIEIFWSEFIGSVKRVDFFDAANGNKSAFVHLHYWFEFKKFEIWDRIETYGSYRVYYNGNINYLILRKMMCDPIPETTMNIHQVAALLSEHTAKIAELEAKVAEQAEIIATYEQQELEMDSWNHELIDPHDMEKFMDSLVSPRWTEEEENDSAMVCIHPQDSDDTNSTGSTSSDTSISKRMQMSMELCGNN